MRIPKPTWSFGWRAGCCLLSGGLLAASFPPARGGEAAWVALVPLLVVARFTRPLTCLRWGFLSGFVFWAATLSWLVLLGKSGTIWPAAAAGWLALAAYNAIYTGLFLTVASALFAGHRRDDEDPSPEQHDYAWRLRRRFRNVGLVCTIPLVWVGFEYLRSVLFTGFAWNQLGVSQFRNLAVVQLAAWGGVYAVSALIMVLNTSVAMMMLRLGGVYVHRRPYRMQVELSFGILVCLLCWVHGVRTAKRLHWDEGPALEQVRVAIVQPNIEQRKKWEPEDAYAIYAALEEQTELAALFKQNLDLVVWPETALPGPVTANEMSAAFVRELAREGLPLLVGSMEVIAGRPGAGHWRESVDAYYNSSYLFATNGAIAGVYRKRHLVPFGEYLPFDRHVKLIHDMAPLGFSCTPGSTSTVFRLPVTHRQHPAAAASPERETRFSVLICFEDTVAGLARESVRNGARFLVVQTNDAWFDPSPASLQHMSHCVFRCIENRVPAVRCANTGVSGFISRTGMIDDAANLERENWGRMTAGYKIAGLDVESGPIEPTVYNRIGDWSLGIPCGFLSALGFVLVVISEKRKNSAHSIQGR